MKAVVAWSTYRLLCGLFITLVFMVLASCARLGVQDTSTHHAGPRITVEELVYDFGIAGPEEKIKHTFRFRNSGNSVLKIYRYDTSCGCLASLLSRKVIPPGGTGEIRVTFHTRRFEGKQEKTITLYSNDPERPKLRLVVRGIIKKDIAVVPSGVNFGKVKKGQAITRHVRVLELSRNRLEIKKVDYDPRLFSVKTSRYKDENSRGIDIEITLVPGIPAGRLNEVITLHTNLRKRPRIDVPVWADVLGGIHVEPDMLATGKVRKGETAQKRIRVFSKDSEFSVQKVKCDLPFVSLRVRTIKKRKDYEIALTFSRLSPAGNFSGTIDIYTDDPDQGVIHVPVYGVLQK